MKKITWLLLLVFIDQSTKYLAVVNLEIPRKITDFFYLRFIENSGIAFSIPIPSVLLIILVLAVVVYLLYYLLNNKFTSIAEISLSLITAGAIGNLIDRIWNGKVIDFLNFWSFPIFNFADIFITCGVIIYIFMEIFSIPKTE